MDSIYRKSTSSLSLQSVTVIHYVDPLCPWSLGLEALLKRLKEVYRDMLRIEYRTGVAVPDIKKWMKQYGFDYDGVAKFHASVAEQTGAEFDPDFLRKIGLKSSLPACLAFKAAQLQDEDTARRFLQGVMKAFLVDAQPFSEDGLMRIASDVGLDAKRLAEDMHSKETERAVRNDVRAMERDRGTFLDMVLTTADGRSEKISETFTAAPVEQLIDRLVPGLPKHGLAAESG